jgi:two-component system LytT family response regulator
MMRVLIVDDEAPARDKLRRWLEERQDVEIVAEAADGLAAATAIDKLSPDVVFLDIQMPGMNGLEVAAQLEPASAPLLVFVTAYDEHAIKAFELNAIDYLLKPYDKDRLRKTLERLQRRMTITEPQAVPAASAAAGAAVRAARAHTGSSERLLVPQGEGLQLIDAATIQWLEADDNYVHVHTARSRFMVRRTLADLLAQLGEQRFARIHKSAAVNVAEIDTLSPLFKGDHEIRLRGGALLRLSRRYKDALFARLHR